MKNKTLFIILCIASAGFLFSCNKDDGSSEPTVMEPLEGKWNYIKTSFTANGTTSAELNYTGNQEGCSKDYIQFSSGGIYTEGDYFGECELATYSGTWSKNGTTLTVLENGEAKIYEVALVNSVSLKLKYTYTVSGTTFTENTTFAKN